MRFLRPVRVTKTLDIAVVGGGFAGSLFALAVKASGRSVALIEKERHPRFAIGKSTSPLANLFLEELCDDYGLDRVRPLAAFGTWQRERPELDCGLKRGFSFFAHREGEAWVPRPGRENELLVAASPNDDVADTHWLRADVDAFLFSEARRSGVECLEETSVDDLAGCAGDRTLSLRSPAGARVLRARFLVDATGPRGFLQKALALEEATFEALPAIEGLYTHFRNVGRAGSLAGHAAAGFPDAPPYPADDAAVHHVFEGGWILGAPFRKRPRQRGSGGDAGPRPLTPAGGGWRGVEQTPRTSSVARGAVPDGGSRPEVPVLSATSLPGCVRIRSGMDDAPFCRRVRGSAPFDRLSRSRSRESGVSPESSIANGADRIFRSRSTRQASSPCARRTRRLSLIAALYASFGDFELFSRLTLLYFAAASYAEAATRLRSKTAARGFLLLDHPRFAPALRRSCRDVVEASRRGALPVRRREIIGSVSPPSSPWTSWASRIRPAEGGTRSRSSLCWRPPASSRRPVRTSRRCSKGPLALGGPNLAQ